MQRSKVEFRICYGSVGAFEAERLALALVHWDGWRLRVAARKHVPASFEQAARGIERTLHGWERTATRNDVSLPGMPLHSVLPIRDGVMTGAWWEPIRVGHTSDAEGHFQHLCDSLRLGQPQRHATPEITRPTLDHDLATVRERVLARASYAADRIAVDHRVTGPTREYESPLSWRTRGAWNHTICVVASLRTQPDPMKEVLAVRQLHVPPNDFLVVVYPHVGDPQDLRKLARELRTVSKLRAVELPFASGQVDVTPVEEMILDEVA